MKAIDDPPKAPEPKPTTPASKPDAKANANPDAKDDLKTLPLAEVEKKLGSSPEGLTQAEAQKRLTQYGPNELEEKKDQSYPEIPLVFFGASRG